MNIKEFYKLLSEDKIEINDNHHAFDLGHFIERIEQDIEHHENMFFIHKDEEIGKYYKEWLTKEIGKFDIIHFYSDMRCHYCGKVLNMVYLGDNKIIMVDSKIAKQHSEDGSLSDYIHTLCPMIDNVNKEYLEANIYVKNGQLVFDNCFKNSLINDFDKDKRYKDDTNICYINGRNNLMQHLASRNVGYGQTGNMSVGVFVSEDRKTILIAHYDAEIEGYKKVGEISCDIWRWQCADTSVLEKYGETIDEDFMDDNIVIDVPKGEWNIKHYYDFMSDEEYYDEHKPMSIIKLIENGKG